MKKLINIFLFVFVVMSGMAQNSNWQWARSATGSGSENEGWSVSSDASGNVFVCGYFNSPTITFGTTILTNADQTGNTYDFFLAKYDSNGNVLWAKSAGSTNEDAGWSVSSDPHGNVFVTGYFRGSIITFGSTTLTNADPSGNSYDLFVGKYDSNGNVLWAKSAGGIDDDEGWSLCSDSLGNALVTGFFRSSNITFGSTNLNNPGNFSMFIAKYDSNGNVMWAKNPEMGCSEGYSVSADKLGNAFVTGEYCSTTITFGTTTLNNAGNGDIFIVKYDTAGNVLWAKGFGGTQQETGYCISADTMGNIFVTGYFNSTSITFGTTTLLNNSGSSDFFIAKFNSAGNLLWVNGAAASASSKGFSVSADVAGNAFVTGGFNSALISFGSILLTAPANWNDPMFILKYDANGNLLCGSALSSGGDDQNSVSADHFGNAYVGGDFMVSPFVLGTDTLIRTGMEDVFIAKFRANCGFESINDAPSSLSITLDIFPNPSTGIFNINCSEEIKMITVNNIVGEKIYENNSPFVSAQGDKLAINLSSSPQGIYFVTVKMEKGAAVRKIVRE